MSANASPHLRWASNPETAVAGAGSPRVAPGRMDCRFGLPLLWLVGMLMVGNIQAGVNPADFVTRIDNPYYPLTPGISFHYDETTERIDEVAVTHETRIIQGVTCRSVRERSISNGVLSEESLSWFAQDKAGTVWKFGEDTKHFDENGVVISTAGSWEAGVSNAQPGIAMPAHPQLNETYSQELAPGVAEEMATVLSLDTETTVAFGTFTHCLLTRNFSPLSPGEVENKYYAPGIGLILSVMVEGGSERFELETIIREPVDPADFVTRIDNPYHPLIPGYTRLLVGTEGGRPITNLVEVTAGTKVIQGVTCTVVRDRSYMDGLLVEESLDWFAQDQEGNVWNFGEEARHYDANGVVISTDGSWEAGRLGAQPGIVMPAHPQVNQAYFQELAPGMAQDMATVLALDAATELAWGAFTNCIMTRDYNPLEPQVVEHKYFAPGVGLIRSVTVAGGTDQLDLLSIEPRPPPLLTINPATEVGGVAVRLIGLPGQTYILETSTNLPFWSPLLTNTSSGNQFTLTNAASGPRQFFRGVLP